MQIAGRNSTAARGSLAVMLEISIDADRIEADLAALDAIG